MNKILIVKLGAIGDVLRTTSLLPGLAEKYPGAQIDWLTSKISKASLINNRLIQRIYAWEEKELLRDYDLIVGLEDDREACQLVASLGAKKIIGAYLKDNKPVYTPSAWFDMALISKYGIEWANELKKRNRKTFQQHMAELLGIKVSPYVFSLTSEEVGSGIKTIKELGLGMRERIVGINTGAGRRWPQKSWGVEQTIDSIKKIKDELGLASIILGGDREKERNALIAKETGMPDAGIHSLRIFASIINQCQVLLSSDSLAMHLAIALKKRTVAFFGPTSAVEIELYGLGEKLLSPKDCAVCYQKLCEIKPNCMEVLLPEEVFFAIKRQLRQCYY